MTELVADTLPGFSKRELLEGMTADAIADHVMLLGGRITEIEFDMDLAAEVLQGVYGVSVSDVLDLREKETQNGEQK